MKRYVPEPGSVAVREAMSEAEAWFICRIGSVETQRAVQLAAGQETAAIARDEWAWFGVIEITGSLCREALDLALDHGLGSLDALHLAAALTISDGDLALATWDRRLHAAARSVGLPTLPDSLG